MAYIGRGTESISNVEILDNLTFNGSASYTLQKSSVNFVPSSANNLLISISGVVQQGNFSVSGSTITFDTTVSASDTCDWILHYGTGLITTVADGAITEAKLGSNAVTTAKINNGAVSYAKTDGNFGKIGQVVSTSNSTQETTTSTSFVATSLSVNITPTSTSSKIYIIASSAVSNNNSTDVCRYTIMRDSTTLDAGSGMGILYVSEIDIRVPACVQFLDSPNTTSQITYALGHRTGGVSTSTVNKNGYTGSITVMEVLA